MYFLVYIYVRKSSKYYSIQEKYWNKLYYYSWTIASRQTQNKTLRPIISLYNQFEITIMFEMLFFETFSMPFLFKFSGHFHVDTQNIVK